LKKEALESRKRRQSRSQGQFTRTSPIHCGNIFLDLDDDIVKLNVPEDSRSILCTDDSLALPNDYSDFDDLDSDLNNSTQRY
jgi:hypothetical protein